MAEALLGKQLENKYSAFKATPAYQQAMLNFLQGQGANMWGQANRAPADTALRNAQARAAQQKSDAYSQWMSGTGAPSNTPTNASNNSYEGDGGDYYSQGDDNSGSFTNAIYNPQENNQAGDFQNVSQSAPNNVDVESGNRAYMAERGMAAAIGMKEPATFVDPKTGMAYARLRSGIVPIGKEFGEKDKSIATEVGKAKGQEEASYLGEGPTDRRNLQQLKTALEKVNRGDFDAVLGWRHNIPYGMNTAISDKKIAEFAAIEKLLNTYKIKQQALMAKGQGHITDYGRSLLNATFPDIGGNINAFKGQLNQFVGDLSSDSEQRQLIKKYQGQGASFDEARDKAQEDMDYNNPSIAQSPNQPNNRGDFANTSYNEESNHRGRWWWGTYGRCRRVCSRAFPCRGF